MPLCKPRLVFGFLALFVIAILQVALDWVWITASFQLSVTDKLKIIRDSPKTPKGLLPKPTPQSPRYLLVMAYFRGGSTFTAEMFQHHHGVFYIYEPLRYINETSTVTYLNGTTRSFNTTETLLSESLNIIHSCFACNFEEVPVEFLTNTKFLSRTKSIESYLKCIGTSTSLLKVSLCLMYLVDVCERSSLRVIKTIRMPVNLFKAVLDKTRNLQLVHLIRDPRGIQFSRIHVKRKKNVRGTLRATSSELCRYMKADLEDSDILRKLFPNRVKVVRYETVAKDPVNEARQLYEYAGITPSFEDLAHIYCEAFSEKDLREDYETTRRNASLVAYEWYNHVRRSDVRIVDNLCRHFYQKAGYLSIDSEKHIYHGLFYDENYIP
ncbi:carbohydrate sulfotransferase 1-like [Gigantopelta aegis]|uniref:carbohydrate sulfotransferase 1-like n=1 Tax=Gigantopelta aegis TaxID=1735272 RepID=UPI001B888C82|nr:carbohydrate sulfotransferase 1-like [Gigantopelta aegis]